MSFDDIKDWQGTAEGLLEQLTAQIEQLNLSANAPTVRTIRAWRSRNLLSQPKGEKFGFRQILEGLATLLLLDKGWTLVAIAEVLSVWSDLELEKQILGESDGDKTVTLISQTEKTSQKLNLTLAEEAVTWLAQGIWQQYDRVLTGREIVRQDDRLPSELHAALCRLGRLYLEEGKCDRAACVHDVLERSRYELQSEKWGLKIFQDPLFRLGNVRLIDEDLRVPTPDCIESARFFGGFGEDNAIENRLHAKLREATAKLGKRKQHEAYTALRELLGRRSLLTEGELISYLTERNLTPLQETILEFFDPIPEIWWINNRVHRCAHCHTLMRPHLWRDRYPEGYCPIYQCHSKYPATVGEKLVPEEERLLVAKPQILTYWTAPAIDELAIFDEAKKYGLPADLYPESDQCDVAINGREIGIDAKSYRSPVLLALKLNRSIGGLIHYNRRIIAITNELDYSDYLSTVRSLLDPKKPSGSLQILRVSTVIHNIKAGTYAN